MGTFHFAELDLHAPSGKTLLAAVATKYGNSVTDAADVAERYFFMRSGWAPGLCFVGGQAHPKQVDLKYADIPAFSLAGAGEEPEMAFMACVGEAVERLSQLERPDDVCCTSSSAEVSDRLPHGLLDHLSDTHVETGFDESAPLDWIEGRSVIDPQPVLVPADWCLRRATGASKLKPRSALSTGAAAGPTLEVATERALLELVERDAVSLWWCGGRRGRPLPMEAPAFAKGVELVQLLRQNRTDRASWLLDLTTDIAIPSIAAISFERSGQGFACGFAARVKLEDAVCAAVIEMMQMELGLLLAQAKRTRLGEQALSDVDRRHLQRAMAIRSETCDIVHPMGTPAIISEPPNDPPVALLKAAFAEAGISASVVDLTRRSFGMPVAFAFAPALQPMPSSLLTPRLRSILSAPGFDVRKIPDTSLF